MSKIVIDPSLKSAIIDGCEYVRRERLIIMKGNFEMVTKGKPFNEGDIMCAITDDLEQNKLNALSIKITSVGPMVMKHLKDTPKQEVYYQAFFKKRDL